MKKVFLYIGIGLTVLAIPATVFLLRLRQDIGAKAAPATTLTLTPPTQTVTPGGANFKLDVDIDPGSNQVVSADIYLTYDPTKLEAVTITNGSSAPRVLSSGIIENGTASIKVGAASTTQPITTPGTIAVVTFMAKNTTGNFSPAVVQFASNTFVGGLNETTANVLTGTTPAKITINSLSSTANGANFASGSATLTPTLTLTPTSTPAASNSGEASPSALQILTPEKNADVSTSQPVIRGTAAPGSVITIVIHSDSGTTVTVITDTNGNWMYIPATPLDPGLHNIVASAQSTTGTIQTATTMFVVASGNEIAASESAVPISGSIETTLLLVGMGILLIASGSFVWLF